MKLKDVIDLVKGYYAICRPEYNFQKIHVIKLMKPVVVIRTYENVRHKAVDQCGKIFLENSKLF